MFITDSNEIYIGGKDFEQCPIEGHELLIKFEREIKDLSMGMGHCLLLDSTMNLFRQWNRLCDGGQYIWGARNRECLLA